MDTREAVETALQILPSLLTGAPLDRKSEIDLREAMGEILSIPTVLDKPDPLQMSDEHAVRVTNGFGVEYSILRNNRPFASIRETQYFQLRMSHAAEVINTESAADAFDILSQHVRQRENFGSHVAVKDFVKSFAKATEELGKEVGLSDAQAINLLLACAAEMMPNSFGPCDGLPPF